MDLEEFNDYVQSIEYENKRMGDFLQRLGYTPTAITDIIINNVDSIAKIQVYDVIQTSMNKLEKLSNDVELIRNNLYMFLDKHYDFTDKDFISSIDKKAKL